MNWSMLFNGWLSVEQTVVAGILAYAALIVLLRVSGKRTLSKMNAFDPVVTVSLGSILASTLLSKTVSVADGIAAFTTLIVLQYAVAWISVRSAVVRKIFKAEPRLLAYQGGMLEAAMQDERITQAAILSALREHGYADLSDVEAVVLESNGTLSVVKSAGMDARAITSLK